MTSLHTVAIIQARMGSSRLPGKVLLDIDGLPMLAHVVNRTRLAESVHQVVVATTDQPEDDPVALYCQEHNIACYRGSLHDVLDRYYQAAKIHHADIVVRITADCPLIDPQVIDLTVNAFLGQPSDYQRVLSRGDGQKTSNQPYDFAANRLPPPWGRTYPIGLDTEVCSFRSLEIVWQDAAQPHQREHVMPYFYDNQDRFSILLVDHEQDYGYMRWTVDTPEDLDLVRQIFAHFPGRNNFTWLEILELFRREPELAEINAQVRHKTYNEVDKRRS